MNMNKTLLLSIAASAVFAASGYAQTAANGAEVREGLNYSEISAAQGYVETLDGKVGASGISIPGEERDAQGRPQLLRKLTAWNSADACAVYYFHHPAATVTADMKLTVKSGSTAKFRLTVTDPDNPASTVYTKELDVSGNGQEQQVSFGEIAFPASKYYRYKLECTSGNTAIENIDRFVFGSESAETSYAANYLSSPSVHLNSWRSTTTAAPVGKAYDWCYQEIMIPESSDIVGTYAMALGVLNGYMGIQNNGTADDGTPKRDVLFSMWDDGSTDEDPNLPEYLRAGAVDWDSLTTTNRFGNEGTGVQTYRRGNYWTPGRFVQFITNCRPEETSYTTVENGQEVEHRQHNMLVSAWFNALDGKGWQYMATVRKRNSSDYFDTWYSFLENYNGSNGQALRKAYYRNGFARSVSRGKWYNFNRVGFGHTDGGDEIGARKDYGQGATADFSHPTFFMQTGGYVATKQTDTDVAAVQSAGVVDTINLDVLTRRVDEAVQNEKNRVEQQELFDKSIYDKTGWKIAYASSEETWGEGTNGRAAQAIDGDKETYWHTAWSSQTAPLPHTLVIDMQKELSVGGFRITMSGGTNRYIKSYEVYGSADNSTWTELWSDNDAPEKESFEVRLPKQATARYFKIVITASRANDGPFVRINEIDVASGKVATAINRVPAVSDEARISVEGSQLHVDLPSDAEGKAQVSLFAPDGRRVYQNDINKSGSAASATLQLPVGLRGAYLVTVDWNGGSSVAKVEL